MSRLPSVGDDYTLRPFELRHTRSDGAAMASGPPDVMANQEPAEVGEECQGKKKSKFQTFKKFFTRKKKKEPPSTGADDGLKASQSSDDVSKTSENNKLTRSEKEKGSGSKISLGSKALSHDSVFVSDSSDANEALGASQDSIHGKVKSLQLQLKQAIRLGSPPSLMCVKRTDDAGTMSEDDGLPCSPPEYTAGHAATSKAQRNSGVSLEGVDSDDDQLSAAASSRAGSPLVVPGDFSQPASPFGCLDNSAARHKLGLRYKACNKRKPVSRLEMKPERDSVAESTLNHSETDAVEEPQKTEVVSEDELKPKVEEEEEEKEKKQDKKEEEKEEEEEDQQPQHPRESLLREEEEGEEESQGEQDVIRSPDASSPPEPCLSEEEAPDVQSPPSPKPRSRASSVDSPRATPEPPASPEEDVLDHPAIAHGAEENRIDRDVGEETKGEENEMQEYREEEGSLLQEVLSSLKAPIVSSSLAVEAEAAVQEIEEEVMEKEREVMEVEEEEEADVGEPVRYQAAPADSLQTEEEGGDGLRISSPSCQDVEEEEEVNNEEEEASEQEEELVVERATEHNQKEGEKVEAEEVEPEELNNSPAGNAVDQAEEDAKIEEESEVEEEAKEKEKEPEVEEEGKQGKREEDDEEVEEPKERVEEMEEVTERERDDAEEMKGVLPGAADEEEESLEVDEGVDVGAGDDAPQSADDDDDDDDDDDEVSAELDEAVVVPMHESREASGQSFGEEREDGEEEEDDVAIGHKPDQEEDDEANQPGADQTEEDEEQGGEETSQSDVRPEERDQTETTEQDSSKPPPLSLPESHEAQTPESGTISPSRSSTTTLHINLVSPGSEKGTSFFQLSPAEAPALSAAEQITASTEEDAAGIEGRVEEEKLSGLEDAAGIEESVEEEEKQSVLEDEAAPPAAVEETVDQPSSHPDQSKVHFSSAPAWQRSMSAEEAKESSAPPSSPPVCISSPTGGVSSPPACVSSPPACVSSPPVCVSTPPICVSSPPICVSSPTAGVSSPPICVSSPTASVSSPTVCISPPPACVSSPPACVSSPPVCVSTPPACVSSPPPLTTGLGGEDIAEHRDPEGKAEPASSPVVELVLSPGRARNGGTAGVKSQSNTPSTPSLLKAQTPPAAPAGTKDVGQVKEGAVAVEGNPNNPFGVRLRKTSVLRHFSLEEENPEPPMEPPTQPSSCKADSPQPVSVKPSISQPINNKPALPKKPELHGDGSGKTKRISEAPAAGGASDGSDSPSWISVAKQKQRIYKESTPEELNIKKEEQEKKSMYVSSAVSREHSSKPTESTSKVETSKHLVPGEKENRRALSPPAPVPPQPPKSHTLPSHVSPKPYVPPGTVKHVPHPNAPQRSLSPPTPVPVAQRSLSCTSPPSPSKVAPSSKTPQPQSTTVTSPPFSPKAAPEKFGSNAPGLPSQTPSSQRGVSPPASPQNEPPWMALAKKKAKAWSEMPQIVQ